MGSEMCIRDSYHTDALRPRRGATMLASWSSASHPPPTQRPLEMEVGGVVLPCLAEHVLGRVIEVVVLEAAKKKVEEQRRQSARSHDCFSCSMSRGADSNDKEHGSILDAGAKRFSTPRPTPKATLQKAINKNQLVSSKVWR